LSLPDPKFLKQKKLSFETFQTAKKKIFLMPKVEATHEINSRHSRCFLSLSYEPNYGRCALTAKANLKYYDLFQAKTHAVLKK
jgi:hypothetical protein